MENNNNGNDNNVNNNVNNNNNDNINLGAINLLITNFQSSTPLNDDDINVAEILMELFNQYKTSPVLNRFHDWGIELLLTP